MKSFTCERSMVALVALPCKTAAEASFEQLVVAFKCLKGGRLCLYISVVLSEAYKEVQDDITNRSNFSNVAARLFRYTARGPYSRIASS